MPNWPSVTPNNAIDVRAAARRDPPRSRMRTEGDFERYWRVFFPTTERRDALLYAWLYDVEAIPVRNSMGGLVMRSACWNVRHGGLLWGLAMAILVPGSSLIVAGCDSGDTVTSSSTTLAVSTPTSVADVEFRDLSTDHVYYAEIIDLADRGIVGGFTDGSFQPDDWITRQQFAKMIVLAAGYPVSEQDVCAFTDVEDSGPGSLYPDNYVAVCADRGITTGKSETEFAPQDHVTRAQLITMVARAADLPEPPPDYTAPFRDFSAAHYSWAKKAYYAGLLDGLEEFEPSRKGSYDFWAKATRAEACVLLHGLVYRESAAAAK